MNFFDFRLNPYVEPADKSQPSKLVVDGYLKFRIFVMSGVVECGLALI